MQKMNKLNEKKNDPEYISYLQNGDSAAVFIVRDIVKSVNTSDAMSYHSSFCLLGIGVIAIIKERVKLKDK